MNEPRKVLIVDGDGKRAGDMASALRARGWAPLISRDAALGFAAALKVRPSVIVLQDQYAGGGALAAVRRMRASVHTAATHLILSGCDDSERASALLGAGADECLPSTATVEEVAAATDRMLPPKVVQQAPESALGGERLRVLAHFLAPEVEADSALQELTKIASTLLGTSASMLSIVSADRQTFVTQQGLRSSTGLDHETPLSHSFCQWVVSSGQPLLVPDAREHPVLKINEALNSLGVVSYAGVPISSHDYTLGSFCACDGTPRNWGADDLLVLKSLGKMVEAVLIVAVPGPTLAKSCVTLGHGISAAGSLLRRAAQDNKKVEAVVLRFLQRMSRELMTRSLNDQSGSFVSTVLH